MVLPLPAGSSRNAAQAMGGEGEIIMRTRSLRQVTLAKKRYRLAMEIKVIDNGPGIPADIRERMFYPLVSGRDGGNGLGLTIARAILAEEGLAKTGLELTLTYVTSDALEALAGELWKANLETLGITLILQPMSWEAMWELSKADPGQAQDILLLYWWATYVTPYDYLLNIFHSEESPIFNLAYYSNPAFDKLIDEAAALSGTDRAKAEEMFKTAQRMVIEDAPAVFILDKPNVHILRSDVKGYADNPAYGHVVFVNDLSR